MTATTEISIRGIHDLESFARLTRDEHAIAALYFYQQLDCLVDLAYKVSCDFFKRPKWYTSLDRGQRHATPLRDVLAQLHGRFGYDERFPSSVQRAHTFQGLFSADFTRFRDAVLDAAADFSEHVPFDAGKEALREGVRTTVRPMGLFLRSLHGDSCEWNREALTALTEHTSYRILRSPGISGIFGVTEAPSRMWPYGEDSNGDMLVESVSQQLMVKHLPAQVGDKQPEDDSISQERISNLQRVALRGAEAISMIIDFRDAWSDDALDELITKCFTWRAALLSLNVVARRLGAASVHPGVADGHPAAARAIVQVDDSTAPLMGNLVISDAVSS